MQWLLEIIFMCGKLQRHQLMAQVFVILFNYHHIAILSNCLLWVNMGLLFGICGVSIFSIGHNTGTKIPRTEWAVNKSPLALEEFSAHNQNYIPSIDRNERIVFQAGCLLSYCIRFVYCPCLPATMATSLAKTCQCM